MDKLEFDVVYGRSYIDCKKLNDFYKNLNWFTEDKTGKSIYLQNKGIAQSKLREAGFKITRDKNKADFVVITDIREEKLHYTSIWKNGKSVNIDSFGLWQDQSDNLIEIENNLHLKYVFSSDLYKNLYKYEGNLELFNNLNELFNSGDKDNIRLAMETITNANWEGNEIYLQELFSKYYFNKIRSNQYRNSVSFSGFVDSLDFTYDTIRLDEASDYRELCKTEEHHNFVFNKFKAEFQEELDSLIEKYKLKVDKLEYSIDKDIYNSNN